MSGSPAALIFFPVASNRAAGRTACFSRVVDAVGRPGPYPPRPPKQPPRVHQLRVCETRPPPLRQPHPDRHVGVAQEADRAVQDHQGIRRIRFRQKVVEGLRLVQGPVGDRESLLLDRVRKCLQPGQFLGGQLGGRQLHGPIRIGVETLQRKPPHHREVVVAHDHDRIEPPQEIHHRLGIRPVSHHVSPAHHAVEPPGLRVGQDGGQGLEVAVQVAEDEDAHQASSRRSKRRCAAASAPSTRRVAQAAGHVGPGHGDADGRGVAHLETGESGSRSLRTRGLSGVPP